MSTSPILPLAPLPSERARAHRRLSTPSSSHTSPRTRANSPTYGAVPAWVNSGSTSRSKHQEFWQSLRRKGSFAVLALFLLAILSVALLSSPDGEPNALQRWWNHEGRKGSRQSDDFPSPHSHFLDLATLSPQISSPNKGRLIVVGDIHGSIKPLESLLTKLKYHPKVDTLLHVGDTVAKGSDPLEVLALLRLYKVMGVRGNHDQPVIEWRSWMEKVLPGRWPFKELNDWSELYARKQLGSLPTDGTKFKWQGEHFKMARTMTKEDYKYLLSLPLVLHLPSLSTLIVHAGLLPVDPTLPHNSPPPAWQLPNPPFSSSSSPLPPLLNQTARERLLLTSIPQNQVPWNILNMRSIEEDGVVTKESIDGEGWTEKWHEVMEECRKRGGEKKQSGKARLAEQEEKEEEGVRKGKGKPKPEIVCEPVSVIYGHAAGRGLDLKRHSFGLDSGCVYGRRLSALVLGDLTSLDAQAASWEDDGSLVKVMVGKHEGRVVGLDCELGE